MKKRTKLIVLQLVALLIAAGGLVAALRTGGVYTQENESLDSGSGTSSGGVYESQTSLSPIVAGASGGPYSMASGSTESTDNPPTANNDAFNVNEDSSNNSLDVLANDSILPDTGETLTINTVGSGSNGGTINIIANGNLIEYSPVANFAGDEIFTYTINDGTAGSDDTATVTVTVDPVNDAPALDSTGDMSLAAINEDEPDVSNTGSTISSIITSAGGDRITDVDTGAVEGIAVIGSDTTNGTWQYSTNSGSSWIAIGSVSNSSARLLADAANTLIRFVPNADYNGSAAITFRAWDQTAGTNGQSGVNASSTGNTTAFSTASEIVSITVNPVNDAPVLDNIGTMKLTAISEDEPDGTNTGTLVSVLISSAGGDRITDVDSAASEGIAITSVDTANGAWQYSVDDGSSSWNSMGSVADNNARLLASDGSTRVRFIPTANFRGTAAIGFRAWDRTIENNGDAGVDVSTNGGTTAFSTGTETALINVNPPIIYVDEMAMAGTDNGLTWANAFTDLQAALSFAAGSNGTVTEIWVADGTYATGGARGSTFQLLNGVRIYGAFAGGETQLGQRDLVNNRCTLSGDIGGDNSYHVVTGSGTDNTAVLDGFTITGGDANGAGDLSRGGGIININGSPTLTNLIFKENLASDKGGGMYNTSGSAPPIDGCTFTNNIAAIGGGMACANGSSSVLTDNIFVGNTATLNGGALACFGSSPHVGTGLFVGNSAANGGAIYADDTSGPRLINCTISENQADTSGGGIKVNDDPSVVEVINTILWGNTAAAVSDQVATFDSSSFSFKHCDLQSSNGSGTNWVGTLGADDTGNIDADPKFDGGGATSTTSADSTYSAITCSTTVTDSTGSFSANELIGKFLNPDTSQRRQFPIIDNTGTAITFLGDFFVAAGATYETFDYHLESGVSPCIDAGFGDGNAGTPIIPTTDLDGRSRVDHPIFTANTGTGDPEYVDMGTYESQGTELLITEWAIAGTHSNGGGEVAIPAFEGYNISRFCTDCKLKVTLTREIDVGSINTSVLTINNSLNEDRSSRIADPVTLENGNFTLVFDFSPFLDNIDSYTFELSNGVTDTQSNAVEGLRSINISFLVGDVNNDTVVNSDDSVGVKTRVRNPITADNARYDVNMDGRINIGDYSAVFSRQGHKLPQEVD